MEKLLRKLLGAKSKIPPTETIENIEATLAALAEKRRECASTISSAVARRASLLLSADSDAEITRIDQETDARRLDIERIDALTPVLHAKLDALQSAARVALLARLETEYVEQLNAYYAKMYVAVHAWSSVFAAQEKIRMAGFIAEARAKPDMLQYANTEAVAHFAKFVGQARRDAERAQAAAERVEAQK
jgi:hypothetical protein